MKLYIPVRAFLMSLGMFSIFPVPKNNWKEQYMCLMIPCMPVVGALIGAVWYAAAFALARLPVSHIIQSAVILLMPFVLSGFLHIDGYMDTSDAVFSWRNVDERRRILKDSHVGAFAVIALMCLFILQFSAVYTIISEEKAILPLVFIPIMSRGVTGAALLNLKPISDKGFAAAFKSNTKTRHTVAVLVIMVIGLITAFWAMEAKMLIPLAATMLSASLVTIFVYKNLHGISGDLCGCIITVSEAVGLLCLAIMP